MAFCITYIVLVILHMFTLVYMVDNFAPGRFNRTELMICSMLFPLLWIACIYLAFKRKK